MKVSTRTITLRNDGIWVDVVWTQESGCIFESRVIAYQDMPLADNIALELGKDAQIEGQIFDLRDQTQEGA